MATEYCKKIEFELEELRKLQALLKSNILKTEVIEEVEQCLPIYQKIKKNVIELEKLEISF